MSKDTDQLFSVVPVCPRCRQQAIPCHLESVAVLYRCPECGLISTEEATDVLGAPDGTLFCRQCTAWIDQKQDRLETSRSVRR